MDKGCLALFTVKASYWFGKKAGKKSLEIHIFVGKDIGQNLKAQFTAKCRRRLVSEAKRGITCSKSFRSLR